MADLCCAYTIAGLTLNPSTGDGLAVGENGIIGLDGKPIRAQLDDKGVTDGGLVHPKFFAARVVQFSGITQIRSVKIAPTSAYFAAVNAVQAAAISALEGILNTPSSLAWTPHGGSGKSLSVTYGVEGGQIEFTGTMMENRWHFTLVASNPSIS